MKLLVTFFMFTLYAFSTQANQIQISELSIEWQYPKDKNVTAKDSVQCGVIYNNTLHNEHREGLLIGRDKLKNIKFKIPISMEIHSVGATLGCKLLSMQMTKLLNWNGKNVSEILTDFYGVKIGLNLPTTVGLSHFSIANRHGIYLLDLLVTTGLNIDLSAVMLFLEPSSRGVNIDTYTEMLNFINTSQLIRVN